MRAGFFWVDTVTGRVVLVDNAVGDAWRVKR